MDLKKKDSNHNIIITLLFRKLYVKSDKKQTCNKKHKNKFI
jgi:hypothetical protein